MADQLMFDKLRPESRFLAELPGAK